MPRPCPFCAIAAEDGEAHVVYEDAGAIAFLDRSPLAIGHVLLIPRVHIATVWEADDATLAALALATRTLAVAVKAAMGADGVFVAQNNIVSQSVPHLHVHIVPRRFKDGLFAHAMVWRRVKYAAGQMEETAGAIREHLLSHGERKGPTP
jgi:histidine triad (HIT) family protein